MNVHICPVLTDPAYTLQQRSDHAGEEVMATTASKPQLLKVSEAAALLKVSEKTIRRWIEAESIPYLKLPSGSYRIPQGALLASLRGNYDLGAELRNLDERNSDVTDDQVLAALSED
jgi:excisionase family DNA binding protein